MCACVRVVSACARSCNKRERDCAVKILSSGGGRSRPARPTPSDFPFPAFSALTRAHHVQVLRARVPHARALNGEATESSVQQWLSVEEVGVGAVEVDYEVDEEEER